jgi:hypothetical protein
MIKKISYKKTCSKCKIKKNKEDFNTNSRKADGLQTFCKSCSSALSKEYYKLRSPILIEMINKRRLDRRIELQNIVANYLIDNPCVDCGESDLRTLDFDHLRDKIKNVSQMIKDGAAVESVKAEISKCQVRCANCHRIKTSIDNNDWRQRYLVK